jgi:hypothetical protein
MKGILTDTNPPELLFGRSGEYHIDLAKRTFSVANISEKDYFIQHHIVAVIVEGSTVYVYTPNNVKLTSNQFDFMMEWCTERNKILLQAYGTKTKEIFKPHNYVEEKCKPEILV